MNYAPDQSRDHDVELWNRVLANEEAAFEEVVVKYQSLVASVAFSANGNFAVSEEVAQETFWQAWRQRFQLREHARLAPWLCAIARNLALQTYKKDNLQSAINVAANLETSDDDPAQNAISTEERQLVWDTLEEIPATYREALVLYYREGQSMAEVALALDVSKDVAKQRVHRGRELLRATVANKVQDLLVRSRPGRSLTTRVIVGLATLSSSLKVTSTATAFSGVAASTTQLTNVATGNSGGVAVVAAMKSAMVAGAGTGLLGGLLGAAGGLGGAFLGCWLPSQMAETKSERMLLEAHGRRAFILAVAYTVALLLATPLLFIANGLIWYFGSIALATLVFAAYLVLISIRAQAQLVQLTAQLPPDAEVNASPLRRIAGLDQVVYRGRRYTSRCSLLGVPFIDIQFNDLGGAGTAVGTSPRQAFGWIALGNRATGLLFAAGGVATGLIAVGGLAIGGIALGGCAIGALAIGGGAFGWMALGGGAIGYEAVGGLAIGWQVASGGAAIAYHLAAGGVAWAHDCAVGGGAWAREANTAAARAIANSESRIWMLTWIAENQLMFALATAVISLIPVAMLRFVYRREKNRNADAYVSEGERKSQSRM
jgi:zinc protease